MCDSCTPICLFLGPVRAYGLSHAHPFKAAVVEHEILQHMSGLEYVQLTTGSFESHTPNALGSVSFTESRKHGVTNRALHAIVVCFLGRRSGKRAGPTFIFEQGDCAYCGGQETASLWDAKFAGDESRLLILRQGPSFSSNRTFTLQSSRNKGGAEGAEMWKRTALRPWKKPNWPRNCAWSALLFT